MSTADIEVTANGQPRPATPDMPLPDFVRQLGLEPAQVVVERNGQALTPTEARACRLQAGDRLEIVRIVAGG